MSVSLKKNLCFEYISILIILVVGYLLAPLWFDAALGDNTGLDGIGQALGLAIILRFGRILLAILFLLLNPIRILVKYRKELKGFTPALRKIGCITLAALPILASLLIILEIPISNLLYTLKYHTGKGAYAVKEENYRLPSEFREELTQRGLWFDEEAAKLLAELNSPFDYNERFKEYYYSEATMMALSNGYFSDSVTYNEIISPDSSKGAPYYVYNAILTMPTKSEKLHYAPISRYDAHDSISLTNYPFFTDCYVECKILYVDGDLYAILGVGTSYDLKPEFSHPSKPFITILSEKDSITTYVDGKYYPYGAIQDQGGSFEMCPNTNEKGYTFSNYPIRKVDRVDADTINAIAAELQEGLLKEKIEAHWSKH